MKLNSAFTGLFCCCAALFVALLLSSCSSEPPKIEASGAPAAEAETPAPDPTPAAAAEKKEIATLAGGCFWCTEVVLERLEGVSDVVSGYMGGHVENPTYEQICTKTTGHAEVIQVTFNPDKISFNEVLEVFWQAHDPTTLNQQGADKGPQYRSAIFFHSPQQKNLAEQSKKTLDSAGIYPNPAVTEITKAAKFWPAEEEHQNYYALNAEKGYCRAVIHPKLKKLGMLDNDKKVKAAEALKTEKK